MSPDLMKLLEEGGPFALTAMIYYYSRISRIDMLHYRSIGEDHFKEIPKLTMALERLTDEVARRNKESIRPRTLPEGEG